jgi:hypothetical protein
MKREDILRHAREQGLPETETEGVFIVNADDLGRMLSVEREACLDVIETHRIPVGNSSAGEMACEWTYDALKEISASIRARGQV